MIAIELSELERDVLTHGINEWGGPAMCTERLAVAMGFASVAELHGQRLRLANAVRTGGELALEDWARILVLTEFVFVSDVFGAGVEWSTTTGLDDPETLETLRGLQAKLTSLGAGRQQFR